MKTRNLLLLFLGWSVAVLLLLSIDSPLHGLYGHNDSAWFFMCGKAVMNGLTPYVDFADSKGPLLWLVYGIGYLLSPRNYVGVWILSSLVYAFTFYYNYLTARLLLGDDRRAMLVTLLMPLAYFLPWFHYEMRAEDFCNLPVAVSLYYLFRVLYGSGAAQPAVRRVGLVLGACFMALVLMKWSIAIMQASMIAFALWYLMWEKQEYGLAKWVACGMAAVALPFVVWLGAAGALGGFFEEYFVNTFRTVSSDKGFLSFLAEELSRSWGAVNSQALLILMVIGGWLLGRMLPRYRYVPIAVSLFFFLVCTRHNMNYYYAACYIFLLYLLIYMVSLLRKAVSTRSLAIAAAVVLAWGVSENVRSDSAKQMTTRWAASKYRDSYERISRCIQGEKPRIMNLCAGEFGFGMQSKALPAGKYWSVQAGMTPEMKKGHKELLASKHADYVIAYDDLSCYKEGMTPGYIRSLGYQVVDSLVYVDYKRHQRTTLVYKKASDKR